jgi:hypothetical protein
MLTAGSRRARWEIVEIVFWKGRDATTHSKSTWDKEICPSKPLFFAGMTKQKRWKGYRSSALYLGFAAHRERVSCARRKSCSKVLYPGNLCVGEPPLPPSADMLTEEHYWWLSSQWSVRQDNWRLNKWLYIRQDALALAFVCQLGHAIMQKAI